MRLQLDRGRLELLLSTSVSGRSLIDLILLFVPCCYCIKKTTMICFAVNFSSVMVGCFIDVINKD